MLDVNLYHEMLLSSMEISLYNGLFRFSELRSGGVQDHLHADRRIYLCRQEGRVQGDVMYAATGEVQLRQPVVVDALQPGFRREVLASNALSLRKAGIGKVHNEPQSAHKRRVQGALHIGGENGQTAE